MWNSYRWKDTFLKWNPEDFNNIRKIHLPSDSIWKPDIVFNRGFYPSLIRSGLTQIKADGSVAYYPVANYNIPCSSNTTTVTCTMKFMPWSYDNFRLNINFPNGRNTTQIDTSNYYFHPNKYYDLASATGVKNNDRACCPELIYTLEFSKKKTNWWNKKQ